MILKGAVRRAISVLIAMVFIFGTFAISSAHAEEASPTVTLVGQWVNESTTQEDTVKTYSSLEDKIGPPKPNSGLLRGLAKIFLGWSDRAPVENGKLAEGARLFSPEDPLSLAFPQGTPDDAKLYGVYFELNEYGKPLGGSYFSLLELALGARKLEKDVNATKPRINTALDAEDFLPNTALKAETLDAASGDRTVVDHYAMPDPENSIHEPRLSADFVMDDTVAMLAYRNPIGSNALRPILSYDYNERYGANNFPTSDGEMAGYTYVDLNVSIDSAIDVPEKLYDVLSTFWTVCVVFLVGG